MDLDMYFFTRNMLAGITVQYLPDSRSHAEGVTAA